ncbi:hypothetical protein EV127DRAFT_480767 [Xylaria flabelliformis]|nr:hypothetical protein EV127DRAFT_480767 [Xylaria flabelliformis]
MASSSEVSSQSSRTTTSKRSFWRRSETKGGINNVNKIEPEAPKGPLGLTTVFEPDGQVVADLIFVHGLNGGSRSTWSKAGDGTFWPRDWLPFDNAFHDVRIHTFGYSSGLNRESVLDINDFANNLLADVHHYPTMTSGTSGPIIFVGHSMGGLVIKKAYILARQIPDYNNLADRIRAIFFLGTPHNGAGVAQLLSRVLALAGPRPFVNDLAPQSSMLQSINDEFPLYSDSLQLFSFFETKPMFPGTGLIVEKHCAVMNYTNERRIYLDANHREVAKFSTSRDPSFRSVRNALATTINSQRISPKENKKELEHAELAALSKFLGVYGAPEDDLITSESRKLPGSCRWLIQKETFQQWRNALASKIFWLRGRPGAGKTILASHVIVHLQELGLDCCYFFFKHGDEEKDNVNALLRSIAWQIAVIHPEAFTAILQVTNSWKEAPVDKIDHILAWRRIFNDAILKVKLKRPQYWVIDAVDECKDSSELMFFLRKAQEIWPLCILATSREGIEAYLSNTDPLMEVTAETILEDNKPDIASFLSANLHHLPGATIDAKQNISDRILQNSRGCFLWVNLVLKEFRQVHRAADIDQVLDNNHSGMDALYARILDEMSRAKFGKDLARSILTWATCAFRPLSIDEIHSAVEVDIRDSVDDIGKSISTCGNLVFIDQANKVQLVHLTAREFLSQKDISPEFIIDRSVAHKRLALVCIQALCGNQYNLKRGSQNRRVAGDNTNNADSMLYEYASIYLFQHALQIEVIDDEVFIELAKLFGSRQVLIWIEHLAKRSDLQRLYQAGKSCTSLVTRRTHQGPVVSTQKQLSLIERWGIDLVRLVNKFGKRLNQLPSSIHYSIPPFCPSESTFRKQFVSPYRGLNLQGCISEEWDDRLCTISYPHNSKPADITSLGTKTAIALSNGTVAIYDNTTLLETNTLAHQEPIWSITFSENGNMFATGGAKTVRVWDLDSSEQIMCFRVPAVCMSMAFIEDDKVILVAVKNNLLIYWDILNNVSRGDPIDWTRDILETGPQLHARRPMFAAFSVEQNLLAIIYKGEDILLWALDTEEIYDMYDEDNGSHQYGSKPLYAKATVLAVAFSCTLDNNLLIAAYSDGDVVVFDTDSGERLGSLETVNAQTIACSPDGQTLATGDSHGNVKLFDLRTFRFIYQLRFNMDAFRVKKISFTSDGLRLLNIGGKQFSVWDPTALLRHEFEDDISEIVSYSATAQNTGNDYVEEDAPITAMVCMADAPGVICGKEDGKVLVFNTSHGSHGQELFTHTRNLAVTFLHYDNDGCILTCADTAGKVTSRKLARNPQGSWTSGEIIFNKTGHFSISQVIASLKHDRLLISDESSDALWSLATANAINHMAYSEGSPKKRWFTLQGSEDLLVQFGIDAATFYKWESLTPIRSVQLCVPEHIPLRSIAPFCHPHYFATVHSLTPMRLPTTNVYHLWDIRDFIPNIRNSSNADEENHEISPTLNITQLDTKVDTVIGVTNERVVFLDPDHWVCSADIIPNVPAPDKTPGTLSSNVGNVIRHFFIPDDWISLIGNVLVDVRQSGEVIFAKRGDLAVIRRGLETTDKGVSGNRRFSSTRTIPRRPAGKSYITD